MEKNQDDKGNQQSDSKSSQQLTQNSLASPENKSNINIQDTEEEEVKTTFQRRPQFRLNENIKRRYI